MITGSADAEFRLRMRLRVSISSTISNRGRTLALPPVISDWLTSGCNTVTRGVGAFDTDINLSFRLKIHLRVGELFQRSLHRRFAVHASMRARGSKNTIHAQVRWSPRFRHP